MRPREAPVVDDDSILSSPWFWLVGGVVIAAASVTPAYLIYDGAQLDPGSPNVVDVR